MAFGDLDVADSVESTATTSHSVDMPASISAGDCLVMAFSIEEFSHALTTPSGWTLREHGATATYARLYMLTRQVETWAEASSLEGTSETLTTSVSCKSNHHVLAIAKAEHAASAAVDAGDSTSGIDHGILIHPGLGDDAVYVSALCLEDAGSVDLYPVDYTEGRNETSQFDNNLAIAATISVTSGQTGEWTQDGSDEWACGGMVLTEGPAIPPEPAGAADIAVTTDASIDVDGRVVKIVDGNVSTDASIDADGEVISVNVVDVNLSTDASVDSDARVVKIADLSWSTDVAVDVDARGIPRVTIAATTDASIDVVGSTGATGLINLGTDASVDVTARVVKPADGNVSTDASVASDAGVVKIVNGNVSTDASIDVESIGFISIAVSTDASAAVAARVVKPANLDYLSTDASIVVVASTNATGLINLGTDASVIATGRVIPIASLDGSTEASIVVTAAGSISGEVAVSTDASVSIDATVVKPVDVTGSTDASVAVSGGAATSATISVTTDASVAVSARRVWSSSVAVSTDAGTSITARVVKIVDATPSTDASVSVTAYDIGPIDIAVGTSAVGTIEARGVKRAYASTIAEATLSSSSGSVLNASFAASTATVERIRAHIPKDSHQGGCAGCCGDPECPCTLTGDLVKTPGEACEMSADVTLKNCTGESVDLDTNDVYVRISGGGVIYEGLASGRPASWPVIEGVTYKLEIWQGPVDDCDGGYTEADPLVVEKYASTAEYFGCACWPPTCSIGLSRTDNYLRLTWSIGGTYTTATINGSAVARTGTVDYDYGPGLPAKFTLVVGNPCGDDIVCEVTPLCCDRFTHEVLEISGLSATYTTSCSKTEDIGGGETKTTTKTETVTGLDGFNGTTMLPIRPGGVIQNAYSICGHDGEHQGSSDVYRKFETYVTYSAPQGVHGITWEKFVEEWFYEGTITYSPSPFPGSQVPLPVPSSYYKKEVTTTDSAGISNDHQVLGGGTAPLPFREAIGENPPLQDSDYGFAWTPCVQDLTLTPRLGLFNCDNVSSSRVGIAEFIRGVICPMVGDPAYCNEDTGIGYAADFNFKYYLT